MTSMHGEIWYLDMAVMCMYMCMYMCMHVHSVGGHLLM